MSTYAFIELPVPLNEWCGQSDALFPVDSTHVAEIQAADPPEPERILFELEAYLEEYPGKAARFAETGGELAFRTAIEQFTNGLIVVRQGGIIPSRRRVARQTHRQHHVAHPQ